MKTSAKIQLDKLGAFRAYLTYGMDEVKLMHPEYVTFVVERQSKTLGEVELEVMHPLATAKESRSRKRPSGKYKIKMAAAIAAIQPAAGRKNTSRSVVLARAFQKTVR